MANQALPRIETLAQTDSSAIRLRVRQTLGPLMVRRIRRLSRFAALRSLIHPDPEVQHWIAMGWKTAKATGFRVASGPFKGLDLKPVGEPGPMTIRELMGVYEEELHPWIGTLVSHGYRDVIDIGAARGYYAVGFALRMPNAHVVAFEEQKGEAEILRRVAERNGVSRRLTVRGHCDRRALAEALEGREGALIVCDCEGGEFDLLDQSKIPALISCDLLVEVHGHLGSSLASMLEWRFQSSHGLFRMMPRRREVGVDTTGTASVPTISHVPSESRPDGVYWLLLLRREQWPREAAGTR